VSPDRCVLPWDALIRIILHILLLMILASPAYGQVIDPADLNLDERATTNNPFGDVNTSDWNTLYDDPNTLNGCSNEQACRDMIDLIGTGQVDPLDVDTMRDALTGFLNPDDPNSIVGELLELDTICEPETGLLNSSQCNG